MSGVITVTADTASDLVADVLRMLVDEPTAERHGQPAWMPVGPRGMQTRELRWTWYCLRNVERCAAWLPNRKLNYPFMFGEFTWMFCGRDDVEMIGYYNKTITQFSDDGEMFYGAYGPPWRGQVDGVLHRLKNDPDSRQGIVGIWRREYNYLQPVFGEINAREEMPGHYVNTRDVPCTLSMQYLIRDGMLEAGVIMRSSDAWLGLPYDIFNFAMLQRAVAAELKIPCGALTLFVGSSHLYERDLVRAREVLEAYDGMQEAESARAEEDYARSRLIVPSPPGTAHEPLAFAEAMIRGYEDGTNEVVPVTGNAWESLLSMLAFRRHKDQQLVHESLRPLVLP